MIFVRVCGLHRHEAGHDADGEARDTDAPRHVRGRVTSVLRSTTRGCSVIDLRGGSGVDSAVVACVDLEDAAFAGRQRDIDAAIGARGRAHDDDVPARVHARSNAHPDLLAVARQLRARSRLAAHEHGEHGNLFGERGDALVGERNAEVARRQTRAPSFEQRERTGQMT
jgi:hypothetical protein